MSTKLGTSSAPMTVTAAKNTVVSSGVLLPRMAGEEMQELLSRAAIGTLLNLLGQCLHHVVLSPRVEGAFHPF